MLFYLKRYPVLELLGAVVLSLTAWLGARICGVTIEFAPTPLALTAGIAGLVALGIWTKGVQLGYALIRGRDYAQRLTVSLARFYADASLPQILLAGIAAAGEEAFFRGFIQTRFGLAAGALAFMAAHIGGKEIRVIGYWSVFQGLGLGALYRATGNLLAPVIAHSLFDIGAMVYFRSLMRAIEPKR